jgi:hypothetical protein
LLEIGMDGNGSCRIGYEGVKWTKVADDEVQLRDYFNMVYSPRCFIIVEQLLMGCTTGSYTLTTV